MTTQTGNLHEDNPLLFDALFADKKTYRRTRDHGIVTVFWRSEGGFIRNAASFAFKKSRWGWLTGPADGDVRYLWVKSMARERAIDEKDLMTASFLALRRRLNIRNKHSSPPFEVSVDYKRREAIARVKGTVPMSQILELTRQLTGREHISASFNSRPPN